MSKGAMWVVILILFILAAYNRAALIECQVIVKDIETITEE